MSVTVTIEVPEELAQCARSLAAKTQRRFEDVLVEWLDRAGGEPPVESLPDEEVLTLCDAQMEEGQQEELSDLLSRNREGSLGNGERERLDGLMRVYRNGRGP